jgi:hypothetical protein
MEHRRGKIADLIKGINMQASGVSKIVSVHMGNGEAECLTARAAINYRVKWSGNY